MRRPLALGLLAGGLALALLFVAAAGMRSGAEESMTAGAAPAAPGKASLSLPEDFRHWPLLGTWSLAGDEGEGAEGLHQVYASPGAIEAWRRDGRFPDGAILVKELFATATAEMTTGLASRAAAVQGWFVMVKDGENRHAGDPLWGDGWGWAFFDAADPSTPVTQDYKAECIACHEPARGTDWIYIEGYPLLRP